jgi:hypothetical protein
MINRGNTILMEYISSESGEGAIPSMVEHTEWTGITSSGVRSNAVAEILRYIFRGLKGNSRC